MNPVPTPLSTRAQHAYIRFGVTDQEWTRAWRDVAEKARENGYGGLLFLEGIRRSGGAWWFIARTETTPHRYFGVHVSVIHEPSTKQRSRIAMAGDRWRGCSSPAFRRCCGAYVPEGHTPICNRKEKV